MGDSACVMPGCSYDSAIHNESKQGNGHMEVLGDSVSFGRFMNEPLSWEKWSTFSHKKYVEEAESYSKPGSVAQKKAFFEAHYKRKAAQKAAAEQENAANESNGTVVEGQDNANKINGSQRISLKLEPLLVVDEKMNMVKIPDHEINDGVENGKATSLLSVAEDAKDQKQAEIVWTKYSLETPKKKNQRKKKFFSKYFCNLYGLFPTQEPDNEVHSATVKTRIIGIAPGSLATAQEGEAPLKTPVVGTIDGVSKNPAATPPKNRRKKTPTSPSAPRSKTTHPPSHQEIIGRKLHPNDSIQEQKKELANSEASDSTTCYPSSCPCDLFLDARIFSSKSTVPILSTPTMAFASHD